MAGSKKPRRRITPGGAKFTVLNPRGIRAGRVIVSAGGERFREGDEFTPPAGVDADIDRLVDDGFIEEA